MTDPIHPVRRPGLSKRLRRSGADSAAGAERTQGPEAAAAASPIPPTSADPGGAEPGVSAQILGQSEGAENGAPAKTAQKARAAYLGVEWSGASDRRNRNGRIAKTEI